MLTVLLGMLALCVFGATVMLWYINENLARIVNELSWLAKHMEKTEKGLEAHGIM